MSAGTGAATGVVGKRMLIGGRWCVATDGGEADVDAAVRAAAAAFESWRRTNPTERARLLREVADRLQARVEETARGIARETGNALRTQARGEAQLAVDALHYFAGVAGELKGQTIPLGEDVLSYTRREPLGVVGAIIPWNGPVGLACLKIAPAVTAGNTIVVKAAEDASICVLELAEIFHEVFPPGVVNVITGLGEECGAALARHPGVDKLTFTGSTEVGRLVNAAAADRIIPVSLELGGKSPAIVFSDVDLATAVDGVMAGMRFTRQSQSCTAGSRLLLHVDIYDDFLAELVRRVDEYVIGDPLDEATDIGALINRKQFDRVCGYIEEGVRQPGAEVVLGGLPPSDGPLTRGYFTRPTVIAQASNDWRLSREEIFGPVLVAIPWREVDDAVRMANDSHYGLAGYVWSRDITAALTTAHRIESGWVQVNRGGGQSLGQVYGGYKQSGIGKEYALDGMLDSFTHVKAVTVGLG
jgi:acyl-CoA reductase-like NAD-dependent aldehyde dehydrogenase